ncbi:C40 family peptidase [Paenibacillus sp. MWE-103]|uniref:C40 family peptidase n=1 Tax=Paenibacillus artemisiicola TaxID=1172618 RepID=A0ABS3W2S7_9BACL|nr:C40 family peptidase [Paenibacillus artemisiicola]MBO7742611.1 C40 family peptidase [Paenibacillus artemisiicola]
MINLPSRFAKRALTLTLGLSIAFTGALTFTPHTTHAATSSSASKTSLAAKIEATGMKYLGKPYKFGAKSGITSAFDCSSFTQYIFKKNGISLPRSSQQQAKAGVRVSKSALKPGDLVFSDTNGDGVINHVSLYIGNGKLLHTYRVGIGVTVSTFKGSAWDRHFVTARRVIK